MTNYKQGDVLLVPFPFTDQGGTKQRPAVVLSGTAYNQNHPDIILAPITSQITGARDEIILNDWKIAGLLKPSALKPILSSFEKVLIKRKLGKLSPADVAQVRALFTRIFELK
jgi:mRNA interferase MazF